MDLNVKKQYFKLYENVWSAAPLWQRGLTLKNPIGKELMFSDRQRSVVIHKNGDDHVDREGKEREAFEKSCRKKKSL